MIRDISLSVAIRHALETPQEAKKMADEIDWGNRARSEDIKIAGKAFKERWTEIEPQLTPEEKKKLKKKFKIK